MLRHPTSFIYHGNIDQTTLFVSLIEVPTFFWAIIIILLFYVTQATPVVESRNFLLFLIGLSQPLISCS